MPEGDSQEHEQPRRDSQQDSDRDVEIRTERIIKDDKGHERKS
jgi:hypothetical protein